MDFSGHANARTGNPFLSNNMGIGRKRRLLRRRGLNRSRFMDVGAFKWIEPENLVKLYNHSATWVEFIPIAILQGSRGGGGGLVGFHWVLVFFGLDLSENRGKTR